MNFLSNISFFCFIYIHKENILSDGVNCILGINILQTIIQKPRVSWLAKMFMTGAQMH